MRYEEGGGVREREREREGGGYSASGATLHNARTNQNYLTSKVNISRFKLFTHC